LNLNPKISDLVANGTAIKWYNLNTGGTALNSSDALTDKTHYFATQTKNGECESSLRLDVIVYLSNISLEINSQVKSHCGKSDGIVTVLAKDGIGTYDYSWDNQQSNTNVLSNIGVGQFVANVKDSVGCKSTVSFEQLCESTIPQVITPNGNGKNETWVLNLDTKSNLKIFNRWGSVVFSASPYMDDWIGQTNEGTTFGKGFLPSGTYFYTIDKKDGEKPVSGFIELIR
jgi:gliding motility-associated-like protein